MNLRTVVFCFHHAAMLVVEERLLATLGMLQVWPKALRIADRQAQETCLDSGYVFLFDVAS